MSDHWHYRLGGQEYGPVKGDELRRLLKQGEIGSRTPVRPKASDQWAPIGSLAQFTESAAVFEQSIEKIPIKEDAYAPMWRRGVAFLVDLFAIVVAEILLGNIISVAIVAPKVASDSPDIGANLWIVRYVLIVFPWAYFTVFEGSSLQATPGKLLTKIIITDTSGYQPGFARAALRGLVKYASWYVFLLGYITAPFTKRKQALHDMAARTVVVNG